ncbi:MAG: Maf family nucleotide pyrophosphatase [Pseudomonadota bacterium]
MTVPVVLASTSPTRAALLRNAGLMVETIAPAVDEEEVKLSLRADGVAPRDQADALAEMKALRVSSRMSGVLTIGADQVLECDGEAFDKPVDQAHAADQLRRLRSKTHYLHSAAVIAFDGAPIWRHIAKARLTLRPFSDAFLDEYLADMGDDALATAGAYKIEGKGVQLFSQISGDYFGILGLPLVELLGFLRVRGVLSE